MNHFDGIDSDPFVHEIQSAIFTHTHSAGVDYDQAYIDGQVRRLRGAYMAAIAHAAARSLLCIVLKPLRSRRSPQIGVVEIDFPLSGREGN